MGIFHSGRCFYHVHYDSSADYENDRRGVKNPYLIHTGKEVFGLGAGKLRTIFRIVLPAAVPGIMAGVILAIGRISG